MPRKPVSEMTFASIYPLLIKKAERRGRSRGEVDEVTCWLTGYAPEDLERLLDTETTYGEFFGSAPAINPRAELITGSICGVRVEEIEDPFMRQVRQLDKLVDELARGRAMEKILR